MEVYGDVAGAIQKQESANCYEATYMSACRVPHACMWLNEIHS